ncbi:hypothetical protein PUNSTDRAFT_137521 [Punctularia strigosozonata HHB-11173 SS5]|uniref:uncharacterized protein n=1 Tax=Punctularia strigosozonata (strain HHB-11173) TaxID=741275 RepID=UPI0004416E1E|nr:uncharacterized protein PUNSTDRAFT_137521 [Punctularia strigosozonata HHB-11173 SS5]EIN05409.1 hypothetical protein PUNSTDRAFT_137521 [Punctularia strigosozonata HHB-11173 SS5]
MPCLKKLVVASEEPWGNESPGMSCEVVAMEHLEVLDLSASGPYICCLLSYLRVPFTAALSLTLQLSTQSCSVSSLIQFLKNHWTFRDDGEPVWRLIYHENDDNTFVLTAYAPDGPYPPGLRLTVPHAWDFILSRVIREMSTDSVQRLVMWLVSDHTDPATLRRLLEKCSSTTVLELPTRLAFETVIPLLVAPTSGPELLPKLRCIDMDLEEEGEPSQGAIRELQFLIIKRCVARVVGDNRPRLPIYLNIMGSWTMSHEDLDTLFLVAGGSEYVRLDGI